MNFQAEKDRRDSIRFDFVSDVIVRTEDGTKTIKGKLVNLAMGGLALRTPSSLKPGTPCVVTIAIKDTYSQLIIKDVTGDVVRSAEGEIALRFQHRFEWLALFHVYQTKSAA